MNSSLRCFTVFWALGGAVSCQLEQIALMVTVTSPRGPGGGCKQKSLENLCRCNLAAPVMAHSARAQTDRGLRASRL
jgi:hypothetical protein